MIHDARVNSEYSEDSNPAEDTLTNEVSLTQACLVIIYGDDLGKKIKLTKNPFIMGRSSTCQFNIDQENISRTHCQIMFREGVYEIHNINADSSTYVNDISISKTTLKDGDLIHIGQTMIKFIQGSDLRNKYHETIHFMMTIDALTHLYNQRYFDETLTKEISRSTRYERPFSLIIFDIDHFKIVNEQHGNIAGDTILRKLGNVILEKLRREDIAARTHGDEFSIITPELTLQSAIILGNKINHLIASTIFEINDTSLQITVSVSVVEWNIKHHPSSDIFIYAAHKYLDEAKQRGGNCVVAGY